MYLKIHEFDLSILWKSIAQKVNDLLCILLHQRSSLGSSVFCFQGGCRLDETKSVSIQGKRLFDHPCIVKDDGMSIEYVVGHYGALDVVHWEIRCIRFFGLVELISLQESHVRADVPRDHILGNR